MTSFQRLVKYFAITLASLLIFGIFAGALGAIAGISYIFSGDKGQIEVSDTENYVIETFEKKIEKLKIDVPSTAIIITEGDSLTAEYNKSEIKAKLKGNALRIEEKGAAMLTKENSTVIITLPKGYILKETEIDAGAGKINISRLSSEKLDIDLGAGSMTGENLTVSKKASIDCGAGKMNITNSSMNNLDLDCGVGSCYISAELTGRNDIDCGIGRTDILLSGNKDSYTISGETGLGLMKIDGNIVRDSFTVGIGESLIDIDGGIGKTEISFGE